MASYVDFSCSLESKNISRLVDLPLYRSRDERPVMSEINCGPPNPEVMHDSEESSTEHNQIKKSVSCNSLSRHHYNVRLKTFSPFEGTTNRPYETYHASNTLMDPLLVQKQKKKKGFLRNLFKKKKLEARS
ncbi:uncharacterized protein [Halyomorpha halys]|uniref:uncharacterized protein n=1 Tax=Halyomorpha halys TaxID=286706 RepID=UPI0006D4D493|nr:uncharacterized protein LOC106691130 [Halyomorpha halys]